MCTIPQVALHWLAGRTAVSSVTSGAKNQQQILENIQSIGWEMNETDLASLDKVSREFTDKLPYYLSYFMKMAGTKKTL